MQISDSLSDRRIIAGCQLLCRINPLCWPCLCWFFLQVRCLYNMVQFNTILYTALQLLWHYIYPYMYSQKTPHSSPVRVSYRVSFVRIFKKCYRITAAPYCICIFIILQHWNSADHWIHPSWKTRTPVWWIPWLPNNINGLVQERCKFSA